MHRVFTEFDVILPDIHECINDGDLLVLTAGRGNDSTAQSTDHRRENFSLQCTSNFRKNNVSLGVCFLSVDVGRTAAKFFSVDGA
jgi:phosphopentomutase